MKIAITILVLASLVSGACAQRLSITGPRRMGMLESETNRITWSSSGIKSVSVIAYGKRTPLGTRSRGAFKIVISGPTLARTGRVDWKTTWLDAANFIIKLKGFDNTGKVVATAERTYNFRPKVMAKRLDDGVYLDLHNRVNQRLYIQKNYKITRAYISSSSRNYLWLPRNKHIKKAHDHAGIFQLIEKKPMHWSELFDVPMPWAMRYHSGHFIHATSPNLYWNLGRPASAGCNRLTRHDAHAVYEMSPLGTRVEVIGPKG